MMTVLDALKIVLDLSRPVARRSSLTHKQELAREMIEDFVTSPCGEMEEGEALREGWLQGYREGLAAPWPAPPAEEDRTAL